MFAKGFIEWDLIDIISPRYNRTKIRWSRNDLFLGKSKKFKVSKKGALRILDIAYRDAGLFACHAGLSKADIRLTVKPKPGDAAPTDADYEEEPIGKLFRIYLLFLHNRKYFLNDYILMNSIKFS